MSLSTYYLEYGRHVARLHRRRRRRRRRRRAYAPTSNTASHDNHQKINSWVPFPFLYEYGAPLGGPSGRRSSAITNGRIGIKGQKTSTNGLLKKKSQLYLNVTFQRRESSIANEILPGKQEVLSRNQKHMKLQAVSCACVYS